MIQYPNRDPMNNNDQNQYHIVRKTIQSRKKTMPKCIYKNNKETQNSIDSNQTQHSITWELLTRSTYRSGEINIFAICRPAINISHLQNTL